MNKNDIIELCASYGFKVRTLTPFSIMQSDRGLIFPAQIILTNGYNGNNVNYLYYIENLNCTFILTNFIALGPAINEFFIGNPVFLKDGSALGNSDLRLYAVVSSVPFGQNTIKYSHYKMLLTNFERVNNDYSILNPGAWLHYTLSVNGYVITL